MYFNDYLQVITWLLGYGNHTVLLQWLRRHRHYYEHELVPDECFPLLDILDLFHLYYITAIILVGLVGNLLSCIVFLNTHLKMQSSSYYLAALATADFGFLATLIMVWLNNKLGVQANAGILAFRRVQRNQVKKVKEMTKAISYKGVALSSLSVCDNSSGAWVGEYYHLPALSISTSLGSYNHKKDVPESDKYCVICSSPAVNYDCAVGGAGKSRLQLRHGRHKLTGCLRPAGRLPRDDESHQHHRLFPDLDRASALNLVMNTPITRNLIRFSRRFKHHGSEWNDRSDFVLHP
ncbi:G-protein coupled receptor activity protein [Homalodisca vitripennis]|nr:G-protein coupled receptor activity protein [Homalodisca vitripennis]KAG8334082.1 G-protein coupled receptor activity protein [Homalodisca vitripennis]